MATRGGLFTLRNNESWKQERLPTRNNSAGSKDSFSSTAPKEEDNRKWREVIKKKNPITRSEHSALRLENWALLGYYAVNTGNFLPTFRDNLSLPILKVMYFLDSGP